MDIRKMSLEELELLSYIDIAYEVLKADKKAKTTPELFGEVCRLLEITEDQMFEMIGDFYTSLTTDKRFLLLENAEWDLKEFHAVKPVVEDLDEEDEDLDTDSDETTDSEDNEDEDPVGDFDDEGDSFEELDDLAIVSEDELEE